MPRLPAIQGRCESKPIPVGEIYIDALGAGEAVPARGSHVVARRFPIGVWNRGLARELDSGNPAGTSPASPANHNPRNLNRFAVTRPRRAHRSSQRAARNELPGRDRCRVARRVLRSLYERERWRTRVVSHSRAREVVLLSARESRPTYTGFDEARSIGRKFGKRAVASRCIPTRVPFSPSRSLSLPLPPARAGVPRALRN